MARPDVRINWAQSVDGRIAGADGAPLRLSDEEDLRRVHRLRAACDAILVGSGTVLADDPSLRVQPAYAEGPDPLRVVLDRRGRTPPDARVVDGSAPTLLLLGAQAGGMAGRRGGAGPWPRAEVGLVAEGPGGLAAEAVLDALTARGVKSVLIEGGGHVIRSFLPLADEITCYIAPRFVGPDAPTAWPGDPQALRVLEAAPAGEGVLLRLAVA